MSGARTGAFGAIAGIGFACACCAGILELGCGGDAFTTESVTTAPVEGGAGEASTPAPDGAPGDGGHAEAAADAGAGWCATQGAAHLFCEDFLHSVPDQLVEVALNGSIVPDTTSYESPPESMLASTPMLARGASATAFATRDFSKSTGTQFTVSTYFKIAGSCFPTNGQQNAVSILALNFPDSHYEIVIAVLQSSVELVEITTDADGGNMNVQPQVISTTGLLDTWQSWTLQVNGIGRSATLTIGSAVVFTRALKDAPTLAILTHPQVYFGAATKNDGSDPEPACKVGVDDILVDIRSVSAAN